MFWGLDLIHTTTCLSLSTGFPLELSMLISTVWSAGPWPIPAFKMSWTVRFNTCPIQNVRYTQAWVCRWSLCRIIFSTFPTILSMLLALSVVMANIEPIVSNFLISSTKMVARLSPVIHLLNLINKHHKETIGPGKVYLYVIPRLDWRLSAHVSFTNHNLSNGVFFRGRKPSMGLSKHPCLEYPFDVFKLSIETAEDTVAESIGAGHVDFGMSA